jgi:hypothetical protein
MAKQSEKPAKRWTVRLIRKRMEALGAPDEDRRRQQQSRNSSRRMSKRSA